jgi:hypothetical protein
MKRRTFLRAASAGVAVVSTWPAWLRSAFAQAESEALPADISDHVGAVSEGFRRAQRAGKPLLVLVIPADDAVKWQRGTAFGELLNHGGPAVMLDLALAELVCAPMVAVRKLVPQTPPRPADPLMVLVETDAVPARVSMLDAPLASDPLGRREDADGDAAVDARIATLRRLIHRALSPSSEALTRRASQTRASLGAAALAELDRALAAGSLTPALADRAAALVLEAEQGHERLAASRRHALVEGASARIQGRRIPGSHWATSGGCGIQIEDYSRDDHVAYGCGMGHVPPRSQRFLHFFAPGRF